VKKLVTVDVLLSTYNGSNYLREQLDSILNQKLVIVHIITRDDGSSDNSLLILNEYKKKFKDKITICENHINMGIVKSYEYLLSKSKEDYIA